LTHEGRLRLSELRQGLRSGREREPFGVLWDTRHWEQDVQIAVLDAAETSPLSLAYLDMNGLKVINDRHGHDAGDLALKTYFQTVVSALGDGGQAYRLGDKADEELAVLPNCTLERAGQLMRVACARLMEERLWPTDPDALLSIAVGIIATTDPMASPRKLRAHADARQKGAKERSKVTTPRPSVIAVGDERDLIVIQHAAADSFPVLIEPSYFQGARYEKGISFTVTNLSREPLPPFRIGLFHPKQGTRFIFPSKKGGPLLQDQKREFSCSIVENGRVPEWFPKLTHGINRETLTPEDDCDFEFQFVLEDSDKVLFRSKRIGRCLAMLLRRTVQNGIEVDIQGSDWKELRYQPSPA
jgi:diguanylate cyclase (GGDEF)-like protein